jgi:hypothetical protein
VLKPSASKTSSKKLHPIESNAFEISSLMKRAGFFLRWRSCMTLWQRQKKIYSIQARSRTVGETSGRFSPFFGPTLVTSCKYTNL